MESLIKISRISEGTCGLLVIDLQEKFVPVIRNWDSILAASVRLVRFFRLLRMPIVVTEQYPKKLGSTVPELQKALAGEEWIANAKTCFSSCGNDELKHLLRTQQRRQWVLCGIEAHVCVQQTAFDLLEEEYEVFLAVDAIGSRHAIDCEIALKRIAQVGGVLSTTETLFFEILRDAKHPLFKEASVLIK